MSALQKWLIVCAVTISFGFILWWLVPLAGPTSNVLVFAAPLLATLFLGFSRGLIVLIANWAVSVIVMSNLPELSLDDGPARAIPPFFLSVILIFGASQLRRYFIQRKAAEEAIRESDRRYRLIFEQSAEGILLLDSSGVVIDASPRIADHVGYSAADFIGKPFMESDIFREGTAMTFDALIEEVLSASHEHELVACNKIGEQIYLQFAISDATVKTGDVKWICLVKNITEKREMREMLIESKKMEAIGRLAGGVAHDLNNILNAIVGSAHAHRHDHSNCDGSFEDIDNITAACNRGAQLTQSLLGFSRKSTVTKEELSFNQIVQNVLAVTERTSLKNVRFESRLEPNLPNIEGDSHQIETALMNICLNALDAMSPGGTLTITTYSDAEGVWVLVTDTGTGMDEQIRERAFEPFFTTKPVGKGTGLGLAMAYGVVQSHNGRIQLQSALGEGTTVTFWFPRSSGNMMLRIFEDDTSDPSDEHVLRGRTVMLVDDEPLVLRAGSRMLQTLGCDVIAASSGAEALSLLEKHPQVSLVLLDLIMPGMDGTETFKKLRENYETPVILVSGYTQNFDRVAELRQSKKCDFLPKPYSPSELVSVVKKVL